MKNLVEVKNLKKKYGSKEAVKGISFNIQKNEILGLLGPNGSGKTTTIGMMLGLLKPTNGEILIDGKKIEENRIETLKKINFISPYIELPKKLTVKQNLIVYCKLYNITNTKNNGIGFDFGLNYSLNVGNKVYKNKNGDVLNKKKIKIDFSMINIGKIN